MEQGNENEDQADASERTAELVNGDIGDGNAGQDDEGSSPQADWTGTESHAGNEDGVGTSKSEGVADHKVTCFSAADSNSWCCIFRTCPDCRLAALRLPENRQFNADFAPAFPQRCNDAVTHVCVCVCVCLPDPL